MDESYEIPVDSAEKQVSEPVLEHGQNELDIKKKIADLTDKEYDKIVSDLKAKVVYKNYELKGNRLIYKKQPTTRQKAVERTITKADKEGDKKVYLTDNQLMMEHIFELQSKVTKLELKNKKRKNQIHEIIDYYYVDDNDEGKDVEKNEEKSVPIPVKTQLKQAPRNNWRSRFK